MLIETLTFNGIENWKKKSISHKWLLGKNGKRHQAYSMKISVRLEVISEFFIPASNHRPRHGEA